MAKKETVAITSRYTGKKQIEYLTYELIRSVRLKPGQISVIVHQDLSVAIVANKNLTVEEINEIICMQYREICQEIDRVQKKNEENLYWG